MQHYLQANTKEMFEDDDLDVSSGSDFDDDEDPDKIEVPGESKRIFFYLLNGIFLQITIFH